MNCLKIFSIILVVMAVLLLSANFNKRLIFSGIRSVCISFSREISERRLIED